MSADKRKKLGALLLFAALTSFMTWPQAQYLTSRVHNSDDALLSIWRISWIAHILPRSPADLLNGNIFYPEKRTLAYTDSVLIQGLTAAPMIWLGFRPVTVYNTLLLLSITFSAWAMWLYATRLTGSALAGVIAGIIFAFVPFRFDHIMHLELQATFFLPLTLLAIDRALERRTPAAAALAAAAFVGQVYCGIYYAIFLATALIPIVALRLRTLDHHARLQFVKVMVPSAIVALLVVLPYLLAYNSNRGTLGDRKEMDIEMYSATLPNYLSATPENVVHGEWSAGLGRSERRLFPGVIALVLALIGVLQRRWPRRTLIVTGVVGLIVSLGLNTPLYEPMREIVFPYRGLRAPARASILVFLAIAGLAAYGFAWLARGRSVVVSTIAATTVSAALLAEYRTMVSDWLTIPAEPPQVYRWLATQPRSVVAELPFARSSALHAIFDGLYMFNSTYHWQPIVNGYSGFFPDSFIEMGEVLRSFPDDPSIEYLKLRGVDLIVVHGSLLGSQQYGKVTAALAARPDLEATAQFAEPNGSDMVFRVRR